MLERCTLIQVGGWHLLVRPASSHLSQIFSAPGLLTSSFVVVLFASGFSVRVEVDTHMSGWAFGTSKTDTDLDSSIVGDLDIFVLVEPVAKVLRRLRSTAFAIEE